MPSIKIRLIWLKSRMHSKMLRQSASVCWYRDWNSDLTLHWRNYQGRTGPRLIWLEKNHPMCELFHWLSILLSRKWGNLFPSSYFRSFCDKFALAFASTYYRTLTGLKRISEAGTQQLLLDVTTIKSLLLKLPVLEAEKKPGGATRHSNVNQSKSCLVHLRLPQQCIPKW